MAAKLLTIGEFARLSRLSPKALRLYDELGLLRPCRVDEWSGYRYYAPSQLERARLVGWLRRLGMPLAQIGAVVESPPAEAAESVAAFLRVTQAEFAERQRLAQFLVAYLSTGATAVSTGATAMPQPLSPSPAASGAAVAPLAIRYAAASDTGRVRARNQDAGYAGPRLIAVADGYGPGGDRASGVRTSTRGSRREGRGGSAIVHRLCGLRTSCWPLWRARGGSRSVSWGWRSRSPR